MEKDFLNLVPKRYLCPYCGKWHKWDSNYNLSQFNIDIDDLPVLKCHSIPIPFRRGNYTLYFTGDYCHYNIERQCNRENLNLHGEIEIASIAQSEDSPTITFKVPFQLKHSVGCITCSNCCGIQVCNLVKLFEQNHNKNIEITLGFEFDKSEYDEVLKRCRKKSSPECENIKRLEKRPAEKPAQLKTEEDSHMNILNMDNLEFGLNKDEQIASTLMGIAVKNGNSWRIYDKTKKEITDIGEMQLGNFPIFILPTTKLTEGDLIKDSGEYYFVMKVAKGNTQTMSAKTGEIKTIIPVKNILGFNCYSKVIAITDSINISKDFDVEKLAMISAMCGQNGVDNNQMNQLLPLMLFKDKLNDDDDNMKILLMSSMMSVPTEGFEQNATMNQLLPLMLLNEKDGSDDDMMKILLMSSMMSDNKTGNNNPVMSYLMLDKFMGKKDEQSDK